MAIGCKSTFAMVGRGSTRSNGADWSKRYPLITRDAARIDGSAILDAEVVWLGSDGVSDFEALHTRVDDGRATACAYGRNRLPSARPCYAKSCAVHTMAFNTSSIRKVMAPGCLRRHASSALRELFLRKWMRHIVQVPREPG